MDAPKTKKRGRPPKEKEVVVVEEDLKEFTNPALIEPSQVVDIKHVIRAISWDGTLRQEGSQPSSVIEDYLKQNFLSQGYTIYDIVPLEVMSNEGKAFANSVMYVLVKYAQ